MILATAVIFFSANANMKPAKSADNAFTLSWSASSFVPPEYKGRALPTQGSKIKIVASPLNSSVNPEKMIYLWLLDNEEQGWANGKGKNYFSFTAKKPGGARYQIEVKVMDENENLIERLFLTVKIHDPEILILNEEKIYQPKTLSAKINEELKLIGAPLFFNIASLEELNFSWKENNRVFSSSLQTDPQEISIGMPDGKISKKIIKTIFAEVSKKTDSLQQAEREIKLEINP